MQPPREFRSKINRIEAICSANRTLPYHGNSPTGIDQLLNVANVVCAVPVQFECPKLRSRPRKSKERAVVSVPEASVDHDYGPVAWKNNVWLSRQFPDVKAEAETLAMEGTADKPLRSGVLVADSAHHAAARRRINNVRHSSHSE